MKEQSDFEFEIALDRGGTFTDVVASANGVSLQFKVLSWNENTGQDGTLVGIQRACELLNQNPESITSLRIGTTVATNALLEHKGSPVAVICNEGLGDLLEIGTQRREELFKLPTEVKNPYIHSTIEMSARQSKLNTALKIPANDKQRIQESVKEWKKKGIQSIAVLMIHGNVDPQLEIQIQELIVESGWSETLICSHQCSVLSGFLKRGWTTILEAYLSPVLRSYQNSFLNSFPSLKCEVSWMKSDGQLTGSKNFSSLDALLSGPAGGLNAMAQEFDEGKALLGFDMGGTSTDVCRFHKDVSLNLQNNSVRHPYYFTHLPVLTVASGGGSILKIENEFLKVGPQSAGSWPGPACYGFGGPLTITDANLYLGRLYLKSLQPCFGKNRDEAPNPMLSKDALLKEKEKFADSIPVEEIALRWLELANEQMLKPLRQVCVQEGVEPRDHTLICYGGAGGQHACDLADILKIDTVFLHEQSSVFSALGIFQSDRGETRLEKVDLLWSEVCEDPKFKELPSKSQGIFCLEGTRQSITLAIHPISSVEDRFCSEFERLFGFLPDLSEFPLVLTTLVQRFTKPGKKLEFAISPSVEPWRPIDEQEIYLEGSWRTVSVYPWPVTLVEEVVQGPALIQGKQTCVYLKQGWSASFQNSTRKMKLHSTQKKKTENQKYSSVQDSIYHQRFMLLCEEMGAMLERLARSSNIRHRKDYSCALFDGQGQLIANAPHIPVHLGSMSSAIRGFLNASIPFKPRHSYVLNDPSMGGTHLPDITVLTPVFNQKGNPVAWLASRGHHADIGGIEPGSMPAFSNNLAQEGVLLRGECIHDGNRFCFDEVRELLKNSGARQLEQNLFDLRAQTYANLTASRKFQQMIEELSDGTVCSAMKSLLDHSQNAVRKMLSENELFHILPVDAELELDDKTCLRLSLCKRDDKLVFDFRSCDKEVEDNRNAPKAITRSVILYCLRLLLEQDLPLNDGFLRDVEILHGEKTILNPSQGSAVAAGNVLTSQAICELILTALQYSASSQGCMNNVSFGNENFGYYETLAGGVGAGKDRVGGSCYHSHMTNTELTDVEELEAEFPVRVLETSIRSEGAGAGLFSGGAGMLRVYEFEEQCVVNLLTQNRKTRPAGIKGGRDGASGENWHYREAKWSRLPSRVKLFVEKGEQIKILTPCGGGYGKK